MRFNDKDLIRVSQRPGQIEGKLQHREPSGSRSFRESGFRERFCKVVGNLLFVFRITELGTIETREPASLLVLENYLVSSESELSFAFGITFRDDTEKKHIFTARTEMDAERWIRALREASYQYWKDQFHLLTKQVNSLTSRQNTVSKVGHSVNRNQSIPSRYSGSKPPAIAPDEKTEKDLIVF